MSNPGFNKRQKEKTRQDKAREKEAKRQQRRNERGQPDASATPGVDPDIAGIIPGPQPPAEP
ncbi:MAG: hypothetical protein R3B70_00225 [Polyangiaceae bacterium]